MLKYACSYLFSLGLDKVLVTCNHENIASKKNNWILWWSPRKYC